MIVSGHPRLLSEIYVDREARQRKDLTDIEGLMESISKRGLINPITIEADGKLIAGERRFTAVSRLGWTHIDVRYASELDPAEIHMIELEENIKRVGISWQEETRALERYHALKSEAEPGWTKAETAEELGMSSTDVSIKLALAKEIAAGNDKIAGQSLISTAKNLLRRRVEREKTSTLAALAETKPDTPSVPLLHADFNEWAFTYSGVKFNLIHCDFPYGIKANNQQQGNNVTSYGSYADGPDVYFTLLDTLEAAMNNIVAEAAHLIFWFSMDYYEVTRKRLTAMGWKVNPFPLVWNKSDNTGLLPDPQRGPRRIYETAFFATRGDRLIVQPVSNLYSHPGKDKEIHMSEKPVPMLRHFFRMVCDSNSVVLDPTAGSANALKAAESLNANYVLGLEKEKEFYDRSTAAYFIAAGTVDL